MYFLKNAIKVFYFTIIIFLLLNIIFASIYGYSISPIFILFYIIGVMPIFEKIFSYVVKESHFENDFSFRGINVLKYLFLLGIMGVFFYFNFNVFQIIFTLIGLFCFLFRVDARFVYFFALVFLFFVVGFIVIENKSVAEQLSIFSYYFLILGVVLSIFENFNSSNTNTHEME